MTPRNTTHPKVKIAMPNQIFNDMKTWVEEDELKVIHKEFVYSYYWCIAYMWRQAMYKDSMITQKEIKSQLGYNPDEKRVNYIIKKNGLLDLKGYTEQTKNFPISWKLDKKKNLEVEMLDDYEEWQREYLIKETAPNYFVKLPVLHMGEEWDGLFWYAADTHLVSSDVFFKCMAESDLGNAGFMLYGVLKMVSDKKTCDQEKKWFDCSNEDLCKHTGWELKKVMKYGNALRKHNMIAKWQPRKEKGSVNAYKIMID